MKKNIVNRIALYILALCMGLTACDSFEEFNTNPDKSTKVTSGMLATNLILGIMQEDGTTKTFLRDDMLSKYVAWTEGNDIDYLFNKLGRTDDFSNYSFENMAMLGNVEKMIGFAPNEKAKNSYTALGHFIRVWKFFDLTMRVGDIPYSESMKGEEGVEYPAYDSQKSVFLGLLNELDLADQLFESGENFDGDPVYDGDVSKWRKAVNTLQLKILINLYKKSADAELKVADRFQKIVSGKPIFTSNDDNLQLVHSDNSGQKYPFYKEGNNFIVFNQVSSFVIDTLKVLGDRRLFYYAKPTVKSVDSGLEPTDWNAYNGVDPTLTFSEIQSAVETKNVSQLNLRYSELPEGEPTFKLSFAEMNFILSEAVVRGLLAGNAKSYYEQGIRAAMRFTADHTPDSYDYHHGMKITDQYISSYINGEKVTFATNASAQIAQIITQKYLATFLQTPFSGYFEYRRTGIPRFTINPQSNRNGPSDKMPVRWMYPQDEYNYNTENLKKAVDSQYNGVDTENELMWILKD